MKAFLTLALISVCVIVFLLESFISTEYFSFVPAYAFSRPWTFITSIFLHANFEHLFFNMFALLMFGIYLEGRIRPSYFILIFFLAGIVGNLGYMITAPTEATPAVGASGAIYGIMGTLAAIAPSAIIYIGFMPVPVAVAAVIWWLTEFLGLFAPGTIAHGAHLAGLFVGILFGLYLRSRSRKRIISF
jgi:hypothetical protein